MKMIKYVIRAHLRLYVKFDAATEKITVDLNKPEETTYFLQSTNGICFQTDKFPTKCTTSVSELKNGFYLITIYTVNKREVRKLVRVKLFHKQRCINYLPGFLL
jgi:hypothetical protein